MGPLGHLRDPGRHGRLGLKGKANRLPNPLEKGGLSDDPSQKLVYILDADGKPESLYVVPNIARNKLDDGREQISMRTDATDRKQTPKIVNKFRTRARMAPLTREEEEKLQSQEEQSIPHPWMTINVEMDIKEYKRALLKIAYELACTWLGSDYLQDLGGALLRQCVLERSPTVVWTSAYPVKGQINLTGGETVFPMWQRDENSHIAFMMPGEADLACYVRVFQLFEGIIQVSASGSRYPAFHGRFISMDPVMQTMRESSFGDELLRMTREAG